ncbi:(Na+)-NQR maturation NqrM [Lentisalinibacter salinarum]|uniref:(Na+)-NQR maturation NqrM n=1 Tax=Lentisalinibacter salinarum TaxID=2992239 RepID=UPI003870D1DD
MSTILVTVVSFLVILVAMLAMAVGVMAGRKPISGSCGGLNSGGGCELCSNRGECRRKKNEAGA